MYLWILGERTDISDQSRTDSGTVRGHRGTQSSPRREGSIRSEGHRAPQMLVWTTTTVWASTTILKCLLEDLRVCISLSSWMSKGALVDLHRHVDHGHHETRDKNVEHLNMWGWCLVAVGAASKIKYQPHPLFFPGVFCSWEIALWAKNRGCLRCDSTHLWQKHSHYFKLHVQIFFFRKWSILSYFICRTNPNRALCHRVGFQCS